MPDEKITDSATEKAEKVRRVIARVVEGEWLKYACKSEGISKQEFHKVISSVRELHDLYARAKEIRADVMADEVVEIADTETDPQTARNKMNARQWWTAKAAPKVYGERIDLNVTQTLDISATLAEAQQRRLRPVSDQPQAIDVQVIEAIEDKSSEATDVESVSAPKAPEPAAPGDPEPDIFG